MNYEKEILEALKAFEKKTTNNCEANYKRLVKIRELEKENQRLNDLLEEKGEESYNRLVMICRLGIENGELEKEILETFKVCERFKELVNIQSEEWARAYSRLDLKTLNSLLKEWADANEKIQKKKEIQQ